MSPVETSEETWAHYMGDSDRRFMPDPRDWLSNLFGSRHGALTECRLVGLKDKATYKSGEAPEEVGFYPSGVDRLDADGTKWDFRGSLMFEQQANPDVRGHIDQVTREWWFEIRRTDPSKDLPLPRSTSCMN